MLPLSVQTKYLSIKVLMQFNVTLSVKQRHLQAVPEISYNTPCNINNI